MTAIERTYTIPLRRETQKTSIKKKAKKAVTAVKEFIARHMKVEEVGIGPELNEQIWQNGIENPPHKVVVMVKAEDNKAYVNLIGKSLDPVKVEQKVAEEKKNLLEEQLSKISSKKDDAKEEKPVEKKVADAPVVESKKAEKKEE
jgi:large subunit ribosomal protein L31e